MGQFKILDSVEGAGNRTIWQTFLTTLQAEKKGDTIYLSGGRRCYQIFGQGNIKILTLKAWTAYGQSRPATIIRFCLSVDLPWKGLITVKVT
jgi:hypothetical protein